jgi:hypothetical protein
MLTEEQRVQANRYDFPVSLKPVFTEEGIEVPKVRAVFREDMKKPIATVSDRYHLMEHKTVVNEARKFVSLFGEPTARFHMGKDGAVLVGTYDYKEVTKEVKKGDVVGLRVIIENSYNASKSISYKVGALRLVCLNGMVGCEDIFSMRFRHAKGTNVVFPEKDQIDHAFSFAVKGWADYAKLDLESSDYTRLAQKGVQDGLVPASWYEDNYYMQSNEGEQSAWGLYNAMTHYVTHKSKAQEVGKVRKLGRIDQWFNDTFNRAPEPVEEVIQ